MSEPDVMQKLLSRVQPFRDGSWDPAVRRRTELCLLDSLTCFSVGRSLLQFLPHAQVATTVFGLGAGRGDIGPSPFPAAYYYGQAANALDFDDTLIGHPGAPIVAAVLAVAMRDRLSTDAVLRGIAAGYEAHWFLAGSSVASRERAHLVRSVGVWDTVAACIGAGVAQNLEDAGLETATGLAASHSLLPYTAKWYERPVPGVKNNLGWAAAGATLSLELATSGQTGVSNALEGVAGMWRMAGSDTWDTGKTAGERPAVLRVGFKQFPACWHLQLYLRAMSEMLDRLPAGDEIVELVVSGPGDVEKFCEPDIYSAADIAFSLPATLSLIISGVEPGPQWDAGGEDPSMLRYRDCFRWERGRSRSIRVQTRSGFEHRAEVDASDPFDPSAWGLDEEQVLAKHRRLADAALCEAVEVALGDSRSTSAANVPNTLYNVVARMMLV